MKKAEIKRRKRVVPAALNQQSQHGHQGSPFLSDNMSDTSGQSERGGASVLNTPLQQPETSPFMQHVQQGPIPVDFTDAFRQRNDIGESRELKRTYSASHQDSEQQYMQQRIVPSNENIDPALPNRSREDRRAQIKREAEQMRAMLEAKERELAELSEEG